MVGTWPQPRVLVLVVLLKGGVADDIVARDGASWRSDVVAFISTCVFIGIVVMRAARVVAGGRRVVPTAFGCGRLPMLVGPRLLLLLQHADIGLLLVVMLLLPMLLLVRCYFG
jgi:hypothetical protein